jgi:hypothetical protein
MAQLDKPSWWERLPLPWRRWRVLWSVDDADEIPAALPRRSAVLVGSVGRPKWVAFDCPCDKRHRLLINLDTSRHPAWSLSNPSRLTLTPSVDDRTPNRRCHFFMRDGRVCWVHNETEEQSSARTF